MAKYRRDNPRVTDTNSSNILPPSGGGKREEEEDISPLTMDTLLPKNLLSRSDFNKDSPAQPSKLSKLLQDYLHDFRTTYGISAHVEMVPAGADHVDVHRPGYCIFYEYPFVIGYGLPIFLLAEELCRFYNVCPS